LGRPVYELGPVPAGLLHVGVEERKELEKTVNRDREKEEKS